MTAKSIYKTPYTDAHRALADVEAMEKVITHPSLVGCFSRLAVRSPKKQRSLWIEQKRAFHRTSSLIKSLGKSTLKSAQAKRLDDLGLGYEDLVKLHADSQDRDTFMKALKAKGVNSKPLCAKIAEHFHR